MRKLLIAAACGFATTALLVPAPSLAEPQCKPGEVVKCKDMGKAAPPMCFCVAKPQGGLDIGVQGKAEIKHKNVPTAKPNKEPGSND